MLLTLVSNGNRVYIRPDIILAAIEIDEKDEKTEKMTHFTRIFPKELSFGEDVQPWIDVVEDVGTISKGLKKA